MANKPSVSPTFYSDGQLSVIYPYLKTEPSWLLLGGPADANECQTARAKWPSIKVVGVDPNPKVLKFQAENGWPAGTPLIQACLYDKACDVSVAEVDNGLRRARVYGTDLAGGPVRYLGLPRPPARPVP